MDGSLSCEQQVASTADRLERRGSDNGSDRDPGSGGHPATTAKADVAIGWLGNGPESVIGMDSSDAIEGAAPATDDPVCVWSTVWGSGSGMILDRGDRRHNQQGPGASE